jgi:HSP20 family protein
MAQHFFGFLQSVLLPGQARDEALATTPTWQPKTDIYRTAWGWLLKFDLAGVRPEDVQLTRRGNRLGVRGIRRDWCLEEEGCHCYQLEIAYSQFERQVVLPADLQQAKIDAEHRHGMLLVRVQLEEAP